MQVVMKVVGGKNDGREINISVPEVIIGRGENAHLRPSSDLISRRHCALRINNGQLTIEDLGSRNGTYVNGEKLTGPHVAKSGDLLRVGRLQFNVLLDPVKSGAKRPKVASAVEAANRAASIKKSSPDDIEESITDWLSEPAEDERTQQRRNTETIQFSVEDTTTIKKPVQDGAGSTSDESGEHDGEASEHDEEDAGNSSLLNFKKKKFGKLPPQPKFSHDDSKTAAGEVLKRFFNRR